MKEETKKEIKSWRDDTLGIRFIKFLTGSDRSKDFRITLLLIPILFILVVVLILIFG